MENKTKEKIEKIYEVVSVLERAVRTNVKDIAALKEEIKELKKQLEK
jgi:FtsZ-binding cell division protein ZapB